MGSLKGGGTLYPFFLLGVYAWVGEEGPPMLTAGSQWGRVLGVISGALWPPAPRGSCSPTHTGASLPGVV